MKIKSLALLGAIALSISPIAAFADLTIINNSNSPATAIAGLSPCSSAAPGGKGIIQPGGGRVDVPDWAIGIYCTSDCTAQVYMTKNCTGKSVATCTANKKEGVKSCVNHTKSADGYRIVGTGKTITIEGTTTRKWYQLFF